MRIWDVINDEFFPRRPRPAPPRPPTSVGTADYYGDAIPVVYGTARVNPTAIAQFSTSLGGTGWAVWDWSKDPYTQDTPTNGGWTTPKPTDIAAVCLAVCEAPVTGVNAYWRGNSKRFPLTWTSVGTSPNTPAIGFLAPRGHNTFEVITGSTSTAWSALTSAYTQGVPASAKGMAFNGTCQVRAQWFELEGGKVPSLTFEVKGTCISGTNTAADPDLVMLDILTNPRYGVGLAASQVEVLSGSDGLAQSGYRAYCRSMGFRVNRAVKGESAIDLVKELLEQTDSEAFWSEGKFKVIPLGEKATGSFVPATGVIPLVNEDELIREDVDTDPITVSRSPTDAVFNQKSLKIMNELADWNEALYEYQDTAHISLHGLKRAEEKEAKWITSPAAAVKLCQLKVVRSLSNRNTYRFKLGPRWALLEPMDFVGLTESKMGLSGTICRILSVDEDETGMLDIEAMEWPSLSASVTDITHQDHDGYSTDGLYTYSSSGRDGEAADSISTLSGTVTTLSGTVVTVSGVAASASVTASTALTLAGTKASVYYQAAAPVGTSYVTGDLWFSTDLVTNCTDWTCYGHASGVGGSPLSGAYPHRGLYWVHGWNGTKWVSQETTALIITSELAAGAIVADKIAANTITTDKLAARSIATSDYAWTGTSGTATEVATTGAIMRAGQSTSNGSIPAILTSPAGIKIGSSTLDQTWLTQAQPIWLRFYTNNTGQGNNTTQVFVEDNRWFIGGTYSGSAIWTDANTLKIPVRTGSLPNGTTLRLQGNYLAINESGSHVFAEPLLTNQAVASDQLLVGYPRMMAHDPMYGGIWWNDEGGSNLTLTTANTNYTFKGMVSSSLLKGWTAGGGALTCSAAAAGDYFVSWQATVSQNGTNQIIEGRLQLNGSSINGTQASSRLATAGTDEQSTGGQGIVKVAADGVITLAFSNESSAGKVLSVLHSEITVHRLRSHATASLVDLQESTSTWEYFGIGIGQKSIFT